MIEVQTNCFKCKAGTLHPFHDNGQPNRTHLVFFQKGGGKASPGLTSEDLGQR